MVFHAVNTGTTTDRPKQRLIGLDLLRLIAVILVLGCHMKPTMGDSPHLLRTLIRSFCTVWQTGGWVGVDLFFVLSGFLISGLLFSEYKSRGRISLTRFYTRRGWKIYPPFFVLIFATVFVNYMVGIPMSGSALLSEFTFLQSYIPGLWNHTWSLAVEEHFYIFLPLVLIAVLFLNKQSRTPFSPVFLIGVALAIGCLTMRILNYYYNESYPRLVPTHLRVDSLFAGVTIAYFYHFHPNRFAGTFRPWRRQLIILGTLCLVPAFLFPLNTTPFITTIGLTLFYIGSSMLLIGILLCDIPQNRLIRWLATIGAYSYSIYLWHMPMIEWVLPAVQHLLGTWFAFEVWLSLYITGSLVLGIAMAKIVEVPVLRLRDQWFPSRASALPVPNSDAKHNAYKPVIPFPKTDHRKAS